MLLQTCIPLGSYFHFSFHINPCAFKNQTFVLVGYHLYLCVSQSIIAICLVVWKLHKEKNKYYFS